MAGTILLIVGAFIALALYLLPAMVARDRRHSAMNSICVVNLFLGWTFIGWVLCLAWAMGPSVDQHARAARKIERGPGKWLKQALLAVLALMTILLIYVAI